MKEIIVDKEGYNQYYKELERLKNISDNNNVTASEAYKDAIGDGWHDNFAFEDSMRENRAIANKINKMLEEEKYLKVIDDNKKDNNTVNIGDIVTLKIKYNNEDYEEETLKLTGKYIPDINTEISLNSPLGKAIYKQKIGSTISYNINNSTITVEIIKKQT